MWKNLNFVSQTIMPHRQDRCTNAAMQQVNWLVCPPLFYNTGKIFKLETQRNVLTFFSTGVLT